MTFEDPSEFTVTKIVNQYQPKPTSSWFLNIN